MITKDNYFSLAICQEYMSNSQFRTFSECESRAIAEIQGDYLFSPTSAMLQGSYVDAYVEGTLDEFIEDHPEMISSRGPTKGQLKAEFRTLNNVIQRMERDDFFMSFLEGAKQEILTGEIGGVPFRAKLDILNPEFITDFKCVKDFKSMWSRENRAYVNFVEFWGWDYQLAIYREIVRQNTGKTLEAYIAAVTKEDVPDLAVIYIDEKILDLRLQEIEYLAPQYQELKDGKREPARCEQCDWCKATKVLDRVIKLEELEV